jgi:hypothetical protein
MQKLTFFGQFILDNPEYSGVAMLHPTFTHTMTVAKYAWGYAIETDSVDEDGIVTFEFLTSLDGLVALLAHRERRGACHDEMRSYPRDTEYPLGSKVTLRKG